MASAKMSTLPNILHEYSPEFPSKSPQNRSKGVEHGHHGNQEHGHHGNHDAKRPRPKQESQRSPKPEHRKSQPPRASPKPAPRETSFVYRQRADKEKNERMFEFWQNFQEDVHDEESERLQERIGLQQKLIRAQDERHQQLEDKRRQNYVKKCQKVKAERVAKNEALQEICRQSLDEDRQKAAEARPKKTKTSDPQNAPNKSPTSNRLQKFELEVRPPDTGSRSSHPSLASAPLYAHLSLGEGGGVLGNGADVFMTLKEEEAEDQEEDSEGDEDFISGDEEVLPWHHVQLYRLYGRNADYFLHPKIETEQKTTIQLNPRLKALGGRAGAALLWKALRNDSRMRLQSEDSKLLSPELKSAFGAFTREGVMNKRQPVKRNYNAGDDVPDLARLMDQSKVYNAQNFRHRVEIMFRSSIINQDRTKVLLYNNPTPNLNNRDGEESIERYMPSWADEDTWDNTSEFSYKKWIRPRSKDTPRPESDDNSQHPVAPSRSTHASHSAKDWEYILKQSKPRQDRTPRKKQPGYVFLTEEAARCEGEFSKRHKETAENKELPRGHAETRGSPHEDPADEKTDQRRSVTANDGETHSLAPENQNSSPRPILKDMSREFQNSWEPLSLTALAEYRGQKDVLGQGQFNQGKLPVWSTAKV